MERKTHRNVVVTGAGKGIGRACAARFAAEGWFVAAVDKDEEALESLRPLLQGNGACIACSTTDGPMLRRRIDEAVRDCGPLKCVVANAGIHRSDTLMSVTDRELMDIIDTNILGTVRTLQVCVPHICHGGSAVIMASDQSTIGKAHSFSYGLTKGALGQMAKSLAIDLAPMGIRVNAVCPSTIATPLVDAIFERCAARGEDMAELWREENALFLRGKAGLPEEVAAMVFFLASDQAGFCTGGLYPVDGGYTCR